MDGNRNMDGNGNVDGIRNADTFPLTPNNCDSAPNGAKHVSLGQRPRNRFPNLPQAPTGRNNFPLGRGRVAGEDLNTEAVTLVAMIRKNFEELGI
jgi:hypothetical protein